MLYRVIKWGAYKCSRDTLKQAAVKFFAVPEGLFEVESEQTRAGELIIRDRARAGKQVEIIRIHYNDSHLGIGAILERPYVDAMVDAFSKQLAAEYRGFISVDKSK